MCPLWVSIKPIIVESLVLLLPEPNGAKRRWPGRKSNNQPHPTGWTLPLDNKETSITQTKPNMLTFELFPAQCCCIVVVTATAKKRTKQGCRQRSPKVNSYQPQGRFHWTARKPQQHKPGHVCPLLASFQSSVVVSWCLLPNPKPAKTRQPPKQSNNYANNYTLDSSIGPKRSPSNANQVTLVDLSDSIEAMVVVLGVHVSPKINQKHHDTKASQQ